MKKMITTLALLFMVSVAFGSTCELPSIKGHLTNKTIYPIEDLYLSLEIYSPKEGQVFMERDQEFFKQRIIINFEKDGSFTLPEITFKNVDGLYLFPDFYNTKTQKPLHSLGMTQYGLLHNMLSVTAFLCDSKKSYIKKYESFFSQLELQNFGDIKVSIKIREGVELQDYIMELFKQSRPEYLTNEFTYQLQMNAYLKITGKGLDGSNFEGYINNEKFSWQGLKSCTSYDTCLADSNTPDSLKKNEYSLYIAKSDFPFVSLSPLKQLSSPLTYELMADFQINIFKKGVSQIYENISFRKNNEKALHITGKFDDVTKEHLLYFDNPTFCKIGETYCL